MEINNFRIADFDIQIIFRETGVNGMHLLSSFEPFRIKEVSEDVFFRLTVDDTLRPIPKDRRQRIRAFDTGNGDTVVDRVDDGVISILSKTLMVLTAAFYRAIRISLIAVVHSMVIRTCVHLD